MDPRQLPLKAGRPKAGETYCYIDVEPGAAASNRIRESSAEIPMQSNAHCPGESQLAGRAGLNRTYLGDIERGERNISVVNMQKIAKSARREVVNIDPGNGTTPWPLIEQQNSGRGSGGADGQSDGDWLRMRSTTPSAVMANTRLLTTPISSLNSSFKCSGDISSDSTRAIGAGALERQVRICDGDGLQSLRSQSSTSSGVPTGSRHYGG